MYFGVESPCIRNSGNKLRFKHRYGLCAIYWQLLKFLKYWNGYEKFWKRKTKIDILSSNESVRTRGETISSHNYFKVIKIITINNYSCDFNVNLASFWAVAPLPSNWWTKFREPVFEGILLCEIAWKYAGYRERKSSNLPDSER